MATVLSATAKEEMAQAWLTNDMRVVLLKSTYTYDSAHDNLDDVSAGARVSVSSAMTGKSATSGVLDADDTPFPLLTGLAITQAWVYKHTGVESTSKLWIYINEAFGLTFTPDGQNLLVKWSNGANKIAAL
jgi:hypothetical protein